jgi:RNA polymerase sigma factor (sigma-70 family)
MAIEIDQRDDVELVLAATGGDQQAFALLYKRHIGAVYDFLARMLRDRTEAEDVAQETFIRAMQSLGSLQQGKSFRGWIFTIARNLALNRIERRKRVRPLTTNSSDADSDEYEMDIVDSNRFSDPAEAAGSASIAALVWEAAAGLEPKQYALLDLHVRQGLDSAEIADVLGVTKNNAYVMVNRLKKSIEETIGAYVMLRTGRRSCPDLDAALHAADTSAISPKTRKLIDRHVASCDTCRQTKGNLVSPLSLLGALAPIPLSPETQSRMLGEVMREWPATSAATLPAAPATSTTWLRSRPAILPIVLAITGMVLLLTLLPGSPIANRLFNDEEKSADIIIRLTDIDGAPLDGVELSLVDADGLRSINGTTSVDGLVHWPDLPAGDYQIAIEQLPEGIAVAGDRLVRAIRLDPGETLNLDGAFQVVSTP